MTITLTNEEALDYFYRALCNGLGYVCSGYNLQLDYADAEYAKSKKNLQAIYDAENNKETICFEDVLMQMLKDGYKLTLRDLSESEDDAVIGINEVYERMPKVSSSRLLDMENENDDAVTADAIIQTVFLGDIIYG